MDAPGVTDPSCFISALDLPQILVGAARRISSPRDAGVRPKPIAMESPSTQNASSPGKTTSRASDSRFTLTGAEKYTSSPQVFAREVNGKAFQIASAVGVSRR